MSKSTWKDFSNRSDGPTGYQLGDIARAGFSSLTRISLASGSGLSSSQPSDTGPPPPPGSSSARSPSFFGKLAKASSNDKMSKRQDPPLEAASTTPKIMLPSEFAATRKATSRGKKGKALFATKQATKTSVTSDEATGSSRRRSGTSGETGVTAESRDLTIDARSQKNTTPVTAAAYAGELRKHGNKCIEAAEGSHVSIGQIPVSSSRSLESLHPARSHCAVVPNIETEDGQIAATGGQDGSRDSKLCQKSEEEGAADPLPLSAPSLSSSWSSLSSFMECPPARDKTRKQDCEKPNLGGSIMAEVANPASGKCSAGAEKVSASASTPSSTCKEVVMAGPVPGPKPPGSAALSSASRSKATGANAAHGAAHIKPVETGNLEISPGSSMLASEDSSGLDESNGSPTAPSLSACMSGSSAAVKRGSDIENSVLLSQSESSAIPTTSGTASLPRVPTLAAASSHNGGTGAAGQPEPAAQGSNDNSSGFEARPSDAWKKGLGGYLSNSSYGKFLAAMADVGMSEEVPMDLPCIIVIGEESSGKSATLERITMQPIFPKDPRYGTKMPVRIKMEHAKDGEKQCWLTFRKGIVDLEDHMQTHDYTNYSTYYQRVDLDCDNPSLTILRVMNLIHDKYAATKSKAECVVPYELTVHLKSGDVPTMELVDLPGIREHPEDMKQATKDLATRYAQKPENVVLCVVEAPKSRLVSSQAFGITKQLERSARIVYVLTKCDEVNVTKAQTKTVLLKRLLGESGENDTDAIMIGVVNRDIQEEADLNDGSLPGQEMQLMVKNLTVEQAWFKEYLPSLDTEKHASIHALIRALDVIMQRHIKESWIPTAMQRMMEMRAETRAKYAALGVDLAEQPKELFWDKFAILTTALLESAIVGIDQAMNSWAENATAQQEPCKRLAYFDDMKSREMAEATMELNAVLEAEKKMECILRIVLKATRECFDNIDPPFQRLRRLIGQCGQQARQWLSRLFYKPDDPALRLSNSHAMLVINWGRYLALRDALLDSMESHVLHLWSSAVKAEVLAYVKDKLRMEPGIDASSKAFKDEVVHDILSIVIRKLFIPLLNKDAIFNIVKVYDNMDELLIEKLDYRDAREQLRQKISSLDESYRQLQEVSGLMDA